MPNMKSLSLTVQKLWPRLTVKVNFWHEWKGLITRNVHMKYKSTSNGSKVVAKFKVFRNVGQSQACQGHKVISLRVF